ncbi:hypothetical protein [Megasphaera sp. BL7]|uniref:hypothetical protein n=1 Tax=Megasphaera sp. BL7 TaxID=1285585 RepID=UPI000408C906|nr:hypothetical protein [Megasphaera sp. BL7]
MTTKQIHETHIKIAFFAMLLIMLAAIYVAIPDFYSTVWQLSTSGNMQGTIDYLRSFGVWAVLVSMIIDIVINIVGFLRLSSFPRPMASFLALPVGLSFPG